MRGLFAIHDGRLDEARAAVESAHHDAATAGDDLLTFWTALHMCALEAEHLSNAEAGAAWLRHAEAAVRRGRLRGFDAELMEARASIALAAGRFDEAVAASRQTVTLFRELGALPSLAASLHELATALSHSGHNEQAIEPLREASEIFERISGPNTRDAASARANLATILAETGRYDEAIVQDRHAIEAYERFIDRPEHAYGLVYVNLGLALTYTGQHEEAIDRARRGVEILAEALAPDNPELIRARLTLGFVLFSAGRPGRLVPCTCRCSNRAAASWAAITR